MHRQTGYAYTTGQCSAAKQQCLPEELARGPRKAHHEIGDGAKQHRLSQVVWQLNGALSKSKGQFMVHPCGPLPVHDASLCGCYWLASHGVDDSQEQHGQVQCSQDVAQILCCLPAQYTDCYTVLTAD